MTEFKQLPIQSILAIALLLSASQNAYSHTRLEIPVILESAGATGHGGTNVANNVVISHGCGEGTNVIASSIVFPDGEDSTVKVNGVVTASPITDFISNWGNRNQKILNHSIFAQEDEKNDALGNVIGFWVRGGKVPDYYTAFVPFRTSAVVIEPTSCAASVKIVLGIADICKVTNKAGFADGKLNLWTPAVGSDYDGPGMHGFNSPATLTVTRDLVNNPLDASCGAGDAIELIPSAAQLNRDMPIINKGKQYWPKAN
ncbi:MAG: hypothetical protein Q7T85_05020 [Nitrosomonas sp.]|nr:hypothetical protein [Nitrosomonas sp.]